MQKKKLFICIGIAILFVLTTLVTVFALKSTHRDDYHESTGNFSDNSTSESGMPKVPTNTTTENNTVKTEQNATEPEQTEQNPEQKSSCSEGNYTLSLGPLMLINYHFNVDEAWIASRGAELIDIESTYGIHEANAYNGTPLMDAEAAAHLSEMILAYETENPGHTLSTMSCFRAVGTSCGRLCAATGTSEHHSGYACDLIDTSYGTSLDTDTYPSHPDWQWLKANSYKYGFIDRYPAEWAGGSMDAPLNVDAFGTTGYYETWHYRYVGIDAATAIAYGVYNYGKYDSFEHYLLMKNLVKNLIDPADC